MQSRENAGYILILLGRIAILLRNNERGKRKTSPHLKNIAGAGGSRSLRRWSQPIVGLRPWPTIDNLPEGFTKIIA